MKTEHTETELHPEYLGEPIQGSGEWTRSTLAHRAERIRQCLAEGPPTFESVKPPGYVKVQERCTRCRLLKRFHKQS